MIRCWGLHPREWSKVNYKRAVVSNSIICSLFPLPPWDDIRRLSLDTSPLKLHSLQQHEPISVYYKLSHLRYSVMPAQHRLGLTIRKKIHSHTHTHENKMPVRINIYRIKICTNSSRQALGLHYPWKVKSIIYIRPC